MRSNITEGAGKGSCGAASQKSECASCPHGRALDALQLDCDHPIGWSSRRLGEALPLEVTPKNLPKSWFECQRLARKLRCPKASAPSRSAGSNTPWASRWSSAISRSKSGLPNSRPTAGMRSPNSVGCAVSRRRRHIACCMRWTLVRCLRSDVIRTPSRGRCRLDGCRFETDLVRTVRDAQQRSRPYWSAIGHLLYLSGSAPFALPMWRQRSAAQPQSACGFSTAAAGRRLRRTGRPPRWENR